MCMFYSFYLSVRLQMEIGYLCPQKYNSIPININNLQVKILFNPHFDIKIASYHLFCMYDIRYSLIVLGLKYVIHGSPWTISN